VNPGIKIDKGFLELRKRGKFTLASVCPGNRWNLDQFGEPPGKSLKINIRVYGKAAGRICGKGSLMAAMALFHRTVADKKDHYQESRCNSQ